MKDSPYDLCKHIYNLYLLVLCVDKGMLIHNITSSHASFEKFLSHDPMVVMILVIKDAISKISMDKIFSRYN